MRSLTFEINRSGEVALDLLPVTATLRQCLKEIAVQDGARKIETIELCLEEYRDQDDLEPAFNAVAILTQFAQWSAVNVKSVFVSLSLIA